MTGLVPHIKTALNTSVAYAQYSDVMEVPVNEYGVGIAANWTSTTPADKTFDSGVKASEVIQDLTYTADVVGVGGNNIQISYTAGGTAGAEVVTLSGTGTLADPYIIDVAIQVGVSTAAQIKAAIEAVPAAAALVDISVTGGGGGQIAQVATPLVGGINNSFSKHTELNPDTITIANHTYITGMKISGITTTGVLPANLALLTPYYVIKVDTNTIKLAASLADAIAGTAVTLTDDGSGTHTLTVAAAAGSCLLEWSVDNVIYETVPSGFGGETVADMTAVAKNMWSVNNVQVCYFRIAFTVTGGVFTGTTVKYTTK